MFAVLVSFACACGSDDGGDSAPSSPPPVFAVLGAFPAEVSAILERTTVKETLTIGDRVFRSGDLGGVAVIVGMTGIGLENATATTRLLLENLEVAGILISGVAGSPRRIGDVIVPETWAFPTGTVHAAHPAWVALVEEISKSGAVSLERCTEPPDADSEEVVCLTHQPVIVVGGAGESSDPFGGNPFPCQPGGGDVFGCDVDPVAAGRTTEDLLFAAKTATHGDQEQPVAVDMETAAIAAQAAAHGVPFIAFRAVSDGEGDPLDLPEFPAQFFAYYRLAAYNAAAATTAFLERAGRELLTVARDASRQAESPPRVRF